jgi:predicted phage gp36 major capsid-like protein
MTSDWLTPLKELTEQIIRETEILKEQNERIREHTERLRKENKALRSLTPDQLSEIVKKSTRGTPDHSTYD